MSNEDLLLKIGVDHSQFNSGMSSMLSSVGKFALGFFAIKSAGEVFKSIMTNAMDAEKQLVMFGVAMNNAKNSSEYMKISMLTLAETMAKKTGNTTDDMIKTLTKLTIVTGDANIASKALSTTVDFSVATNKNLEISAQLIGRAYQNGTNVLKRYGVEVQTNVKGMEALNKVNEKFKGSAVEYLTTVTGQVKQMKSTWTEAGESLATTTFKPFLTIVGFLNWYGDLQKKFFDLFQKNKLAPSDALIEQQKNIDILIDKKNKLKETDAEYAHLSDVIHKRQMEWQDKYNEEQEGKKKIKNTSSDVKYKGETFSEVELTQFLERKDVIKTMLEDVRKLENENYARRITDKEQFGEAYALVDEITNSKQAKGLQSSLSGLSKLMSSHNKTLFEIGKGASMAMIPIETAQSAMDIFKGFTQAVPPPLGIALGIAGAGVATAYGVARLAEVASTNYNPKGASGGVLGGFSEPLLTTLLPTEIVIPQKFSEGIAKGDYALTSKNDTTNNNNSNYHIAIHTDGLTDIKQIDAVIRDIINPAQLRYNMAKGR